MKNLKDIINEKLVLSKTYKSKKTLHPQTTRELREMIKREIDEHGWECNLNHIDVTKFPSLCLLFADNGWEFNFKKFNGDISQWDLSHTTNLASMFYGSDFDGDISDWDVSNVRIMEQMFADSKFTGNNGDISDWKVEKVDNMFEMFYNSAIDINLEKWQVNKSCDLTRMFDKSKLYKNTPSWFDKNYWI